jgi:hypothetical protein
VRSYSLLAPVRTPLTAPSTPDRRGARLRLAQRLHWESSAAPTIETGASK